MEIKCAYQTNEHGIITSPGKFEGEMYYVPHFWDLLLDGCADEDNGSIASFDITDEDRTMFPELKGISKLSLYETDDGFVTASYQESN